MSSLKICPQCGAEYELDQRFCPKDGTTLRLQNGSGDLVGAIVADRYHVLRKLGEGGMGQVYLARHEGRGTREEIGPSVAPTGTRVSLALSAGGLVPVGVLGSAMVPRRDGVKADQTVNVTDPARAPSPVSPPRDTTRNTGRIDSPQAAKSAVRPEGEVRPSVAETSATLDSLDKIVEGDASPAQTEGVLRALQQMRGRIRGNDMIVQAGIVEAGAQSTRHHQAEACAALRRVETRARTTRLSRRVENTIAIANCP